jgi:glycine/D-amino acid oxidase-like deaminating enzyme
MRTNRIWAGKALTRDPFSHDFKAVPYWWEDTPPPQLDAGALPDKVDVAIIGSGYTGLNAALQTARGGRTTLVLDAEAAGHGCSTRNGGQISTSIKPSFEELSARHGEAEAFAILREGHTALSWIGEMIKAEGIDCDYKVAGRFHAAHNKAQYEKLAGRIARQPKGLEVPAYMVPRSEQHRELGTDAYHGGVVYPRHASLDPARYHAGLLRLVIKAGAEVMPHCAAINIAREGSGFRITTSRGPVAARNVVVATNGYTGTVSPWHRRRVIPIGSYIIATAPLPAGMMDRLMPTDRVLGDTRRVVCYYRPSPDRSRILYGGRVSFRETDPRVSGPKLHRDLVGIFPELAETSISHSWAGFVAYTFDTLAHVGCHDGMHYAMGYCGSGVSMASYLGMRIGQQVLGLPEGATAFDHLKFETRPFYTGNPWFLSASVMYYRFLDSLNL